MKPSMVCRMVLLLGLLGTAHGASASLLYGELSSKISIGTLSIMASPVVSAVGSVQGGAALSAGPVVLVSGVSLIVSGLAHNDNMAEVLLTAVGSVGHYSVTVSAAAANAVGLAVGATVQVLAESSGTILVTSGKVLAFVPNALGEALLSQQRLAAP